MINIQFSDNSSTLIVGYFGSKQDTTSYENIGEVDVSDPRWIIFYEGFFECDRFGLPVPFYK